MRVLLHGDGGPTIGAGHVVRLVSLAEEAVRSGHDVLIAGHVEGGFLRQLVEGTEAAVVNLKARGGGEALREKIHQFDPDVLHLDSYEVDGRVDAAGSLLSNMEDGSYGRRPADLGIDATLGAEDQVRPDDGSKVHLRGGRFIPLRRSVTRFRRAWRSRGEARRVLVVLGGTDARGLTTRVLGLLNEVGTTVHVTVIAQPEALALIRSECGRFTNLELELSPPVDDIAKLAVGHDLVVSAAGTTVWELCCVGVPMALVQAVENQRVGYDYVVASHAAFGLGALDSQEGEASAAEALRRALSEADVREATAQAAARLVDPYGAWRIVQAWEHLLTVGVRDTPVHNSDLTCRRATANDAGLLLAWRNDSMTRLSSRSRDPVQPEQHAAWLAGAIESEDRLLLIVSDGGRELGTVRWDERLEGCWEASITVAPEFRGQFLAGQILEAGERALSELHPELDCLLATVQEGNNASIRLFQRAGYMPELPADEKGFAVFRKSLR